jgi:hypothetical protein
MKVKSNGTVKHIIGARAVKLNVHLKKEEEQKEENPLATVLFLVQQQIKEHTETPWDEDSLH